MEKNSLNLKPLERMTDDFGLLQHGYFSLPDYRYGYCIDDNARAAWLMARIINYIDDKSVKTSKTAEKLLRRYLAFMNMAIGADGEIINFFDFCGNALEESGSSDSYARTFLALSYIANNMSLEIAAPAADLLTRLSQNEIDLPPHSLAHYLLGFTYHKTASEEKKEHIFKCCEKMHDYFENSAWNWYLDIMTYDNGRLCEAAIVAGDRFELPKLMQSGFKALDHLIKCTFSQGYFSPIGCHGWYKANGDRAEFDQQPIEADSMARALMAAYRITGNHYYIKLITECRDWFYGANILGVSLVNDEFGGAYDGLTGVGVNLNQGAESNIALVSTILSVMELEKEANNYNDEKIKV